MSLLVNKTMVCMSGKVWNSGGVVGTGGIHLDPRGKIEQTFACGLGYRTNNEAK